MRTNINVFLLGLTVFAAATFASCNQSTTSTNEGSTDTTVVEGPAISVNPVAHSKQFPGAELKISSITSEKRVQIPLC